jgi:hypothetical protein
MRDDTAIALDIARRRLRQTSRDQPVEIERIFVREIGEQLELAARGLLEAVEELERRIDALDERR